MATTHTPTTGRQQVGPIGRLGRWTATHFRVVVTAWVVVAVGLGILAPRVETALSGAGWEATGSESVAARQLIDKNFDGAGSYGLTVVVHSRGQDRLRPRLPAGAAGGRGEAEERPGGDAARGCLGLT